MITPSGEINTPVLKIYVVEHLGTYENKKGSRPKLKSGHPSDFIPN